MTVKTQLGEKLKEGIASVLPIALIVAILCLTITPIPTDLMLSFIIGTAMLIIGLGLFTYGADNSMSLIGSHIGAKLTASRKLLLILFMSFLLGVIITIAEPDLQVLANNVPHIDTMVLIITVSIGVGFFLMLCMIRIFFKIQLRWILLFFYAIAFILAAFSDSNFLSVAFDSGGVTTGPMTVPFIMALGVGVSSIRSDKNAESDSFGLVALCSIGPILAVLILGFFYSGDIGAIAASTAENYADTVELGKSFFHAIPEYMFEVAMALAPIVVFFLLFQFFALKLRRLPFIRIVVGLIFTYVGLVLFLTGANIGFMPIGQYIGESLAGGGFSWILIPIGMIIGYFIVSAEPAVHVLKQQVETITARTHTKATTDENLSFLFAFFISNSSVYQKAIFSSIYLTSSLTGMRTCSMESLSLTVTQLSAGVFSSPTVSKSTVTQ